MKCPECGGKGKVSKYFYEKVGFGKYEKVCADVQCEECDGTGEVTVTNEEMFVTLTTEEKAKVLARICVGAADDCDKSKTVKLYAPYWRRWLREEYRGKEKS